MTVNSNKVKNIKKLRVLKGKKGTTKKAIKKTVVRSSNLGVGAYAMDLIRDGKTNEATLTAVLKKFPKAKTTPASINWYRHEMRRNGEKKVKTARELKKAS